MNERITKQFALRRQVEALLWALTIWMPPQANEYIQRDLDAANAYLNRHGLTDPEQMRERNRAAVKALYEDETDPGKLWALVGGEHASGCVIPSIPTRRDPETYWPNVERTLEWYAHDSNIECGIHGHWDEGREEWIADMGYRAAAVLHGGEFPNDREVADNL